MKVVGGKEVLKVKGICPVSGLLGDSLGKRECLETEVQGSRSFEFPSLRDFISVESRCVVKYTQDFGFI